MHKSWIDGYWMGITNRCSTTGWSNRRVWVGRLVVGWVHNRVRGGG